MNEMDVNFRNENKKPQGFSVKKKIWKDKDERSSRQSGRGGGSETQKMGSDEVDIGGGK